MNYIYRLIFPLKQRRAATNDRPCLLLYCILWYDFCQSLQVQFRVESLELRVERRLIYLIANCVACLALWFVVPHIRPPHSPRVLFPIIVVIVAIFMLVQLSIPRWLASLKMKPIWAVALIIGCLAAWLAIVMTVAAPYTRYDTAKYGSVPVKITKTSPPKTIALPGKMPVFDKKGKVVGEKPIKIKGWLAQPDINFKLLAFSMHAGSSRAFTTLLMIIAASAFGYLVSFILREPNIVLPVAGIAAYVDLWTVLAGPTFKAIKEAPHVVNAVSAAIPAVGGAAHGFAPISFIGPADFIFFALFLGAAYRLKMEPNRTFWIAFPLLTLGMAAVLLGVFPIGLPALTLIGLAVVLGNFRHFKLKREEYIAMGIVAALLIGAIYVVTQLMRGK